MSTGNIDESLPAEIAGLQPRVSELGAGAAQSIRRIAGPTMTLAIVAVVKIYFQP